MRLLCSQGLEDGRAVECVELSPSVIEGAAQFAAYSGDVLRSPKVRIIEDDGVNFLRRSPARYDAIISDGKSRLGQAGNALCCNSRRAPKPAATISGNMTSSA